MLHLLAHILVPPGVAFAFYRGRAARAALVLLATMAVDVDHLLATPVYDPERCSIGFHPLHTAPAMALYALLFVLPLATRWAPRVGVRVARGADVAHLVGLGLLLHMALDWIDCLT